MTRPILSKGLDHRSHDPFTWYPVTVEWGKPWGAPFAGSVQPVSVADDPALAAAVAASLGQPNQPLFSVDSGDVLATLGLSPGRPRSSPMAYPHDLGWVELDDGTQCPFVAHCVARGWLWRGPLAVVMNSPWMASWYLGPKAHPNDGRLDITSGRLGWHQSLLARRRVTSGSHLPHPDLQTRRVAAWSHDFGRSRQLWIDGVKVAAVRSIRVRVQPDAFTLVA